MWSFLSVQGRGVPLLTPDFMWEMHTPRSLGPQITALAVYLSPKYIFIHNSDMSHHRDS